MHSQKDLRGLLYIVWASEEIKKEFIAQPKEFLKDFGIIHLSEKNIEVIDHCNKPSKKCEEIAKIFWEEIDDSNIRINIPPNPEDFESIKNEVEAEIKKYEDISDDDLENAAGGGDFKKNEVINPVTGKIDIKRWILRRPGEPPISLPGITYPGQEPDINSGGKTGSFSDACENVNEEKGSGDDYDEVDDFSSWDNDLGEGSGSGMGDGSGSGIGEGSGSGMGEGSGSGMGEGSGSGNN